MPNSDYEIISEEFQDVNNTQVRRAQTPSTETVDANASSSQVTESPTAAPAVARNRWLWGGGESSPELERLKQLHATALKIQSPFLRQWRSFVVLGVVLFYPAAMVIGTNQLIVWIAYCGIGSLTSVFLMSAGLRLGSIWLCALAWQLIVMVPAMPGIVYGVAYGLGTILQSAGFKFEGQ